MDDRELIAMVLFKLRSAASRITVLTRQVGSREVAECLRGTVQVLSDQERRLNALLERLGGDENDPAPPSPRS